MLPLFLHLLYSHQNAITYDNSSEHDFNYPLYLPLSLSEWFLALSMSDQKFLSLGSIKFELQVKIYTAVFSLDLQAATLIRSFKGREEHVHKPHSGIGEVRS